MSVSCLVTRDSGHGESIMVVLVGYGTRYRRRSMTVVRYGRRYQAGESEGVKQSYVEIDDRREPSRAAGVTISPYNLDMQFNGMAAQASHMSRTRAATIAHTPEEAVRTHTVCLFTSPALLASLLFYRPTLPPPHRILPRLASLRAAITEDGRRKCAQAKTTDKHSAYGRMAQTRMASAVAAEWVDWTYCGSDGRL